MKTFLLKDKQPTVKWGHKWIPHGTYFEGNVPEGYGLACSPHDPYIVLDIDKHGDINGFDNIPSGLLLDLSEHFCYDTKNNGRHIWLKYSGKKELLNKTSGLGIDLRTCKGYVKWYLDADIRKYIHLVKDTSKDLNNWLESLFTAKYDKE